MATYKIIRETHGEATCLAAAQKWLEQHWRDWVPDERCESYTREGTL